MEPLNGVIPGTFVNAVPQSLQIFPVPGQDASGVVDHDLDKEHKKSQFLRIAQPLLQGEIPPELRVSMHAELRVLMVRIVNEYGDTLRELPPERTLDMVADIVSAMRDREEGRRAAIQEAIEGMLNGKRARHQAHSGRIGLHIAKTH